MILNEFALVFSNILLVHDFDNRDHFTYIYFSSLCEKM